MKIEKLNNNSYRIRKTYKGKTYSVVVPYRPTDKEAISLMANAMEKPSTQKTGNTFNDVFLLACEEKKKLKSAQTIKKYKADYKRFISDELSKTRISDITLQFLKSYTADMVNRIKPIKKAFLNYKTLLNLIFNYAVDHDYIAINLAEKINNKEYLVKCENKKVTAEDKAMSPKQIQDITDEIDRRFNSPDKYGELYSTGYIFKLVSYTGMRVGEVCALQWDDIKDTYIHIHAQQLYNPDSKKYIYAEWTKDEKGVSNGGRMFPLTNNIKTLLDEIKKRQDELKMDVKWVFAGTDGKWITCNAYEKFLERICTRLGYDITNNHAIRMYFNSYVLIPAGVTVANRAKLLGHSVEVNLQNYTFEDHDYCNSALTALNKNS